jgi:DNA-binding winged helix-turn-helix (wHTH) protein/tetratricopeptide (TPR) repeat protein
MGHKHLKTEAIYQFGDFRVDPLERTLRRNQAVVALNRRAFDVLLYLVRNPGRAVAKDELMKNVWQDAFVDENNLSQSISALRRALNERPDAPTYIATLPGRGYQFVMPVEAIPNVASLTLRQALHRPPESVLVLEQRRLTTHVITEEHSALQTTRTRYAPFWLAAAVVAALAAGGYGLWTHLHPSPGSATIVVADFLNTTGDSTFDNTLHRALEIDLGQSPYLDVMSERAVVGELLLMGKPGDAPLNADLARQVCERNNRQAVLTGSIASLGNRYLLTLEATACATGEHLAAAKAEAASKEEVLAALDKVADKVRSRLGESARSVASYEVPIAQVTTPSLEALKAFSVGRYMDAQGKDPADALRSYQQAVEIDPQFAVAYGEIATHYYNLGEFHLASQFYKKAFDLSDNVGAKERLTIRAHYYAEGLNDQLEGIKAYQVWAATYPLEWIPWANIANQYTQLGEYEASIEAGQEALKRSRNRSTYMVLARAFKRASRFEEAKIALAEMQKLGVDNETMHAMLYEIAFVQHDAPALVRESAWGAVHSGWYFLDYEANAAAARGQYKTSADLFEQSYAAAQRDGLGEAADNVLEDRAWVEIQLGLPGAAKATLQRVALPNRASGDEAILRAATGDTAFAERFLALHARDGVSNTEMAYIVLPRVRSILAMDLDKPLAAVAALEPSRPYELATFDVPTERGAALLKAGMAAPAAAQYRKVLENPGVNGISTLYPLAHLGLARALALGGHTADSRSEYAALLDAWKDADPSLPVLRNAKAEMAALSSH